MIGNKVVIAALFLVLLLTLGCLGAVEEQKKSGRDSVLVDGGKDYEEVKEPINGDSEEGEGKEDLRRIDELLIKGKKLYVEFATVPKQGITPSLKTTWKVYYDFSMNPPAFKVEKTEECYQDANCEKFSDIYEKRSVYDYSNKKYMECKLNNPDNCQTLDWKEREWDIENTAKMFGMIYDNNGKFVDISGEGPLVYGGLLNDFEYVGEDTYRGFNVKVYRGKGIDGEIYVYDDAVILGKKGVGAVAITPLVPGEKALYQLVEGSLKIELR